MLDPKGLNLSSYMTVGDVFHAHISDCLRMNMSLQAGPG